MVQKRYQRFTKDGIVWSSWMNFCNDDSKLEYLQKEEKWQLKPKLKNEFRII